MRLTSTCFLLTTEYYNTAGNDKTLKQESTSASVELTQTRHSHSKQLFHGGQISRGVSTGSAKKLHTMLVSVYFLAVAEI